MSNPTKYIAESLRLARTLCRRCAYKWHPVPLHGYLGWSGRGNVGDDSIYQGIRRLHPETKWLPGICSGKGIRLAARLGLDGPAFFETVVLGGGTLISPGYSRLWVEELLRLGQTVWSCGTGVGSAGWTQDPDPDISLWHAPLSDFRSVAVRGPISKERLEAIGIRNVKVCGDLALGLALDEIRPLADPPLLGINLSVPARIEDCPQVTPAIEVVQNVAKRWIQNNGDILPVALARDDLPVLREFCRRTRVDPNQIVAARNPLSVREALSTCSALVGIRLHSAVLATCVGVPPIMLGYREKCLDFMLSMDLEEAHINLLTTVPETIEDRIEALLRTPPKSPTEILRRAHGWRALQQEYVADNLNA